MAKWNLTLCDMHRVEAQHLLDRLRIAMAALDVVIKIGRGAEGETDVAEEIAAMTVAAERALARIEGDE
jgi:hypothetical protein